MLKTTLITGTLFALLASTAVPALAQQSGTSTGTNAQTGASTSTPTNNGAGNNTNMNAASTTGTGNTMDAGNTMSTGNTMGSGNTMSPDNSMGTGNTMGSDNMDMSDDSYNSVMTSIRDAADLDLSSITDASNIRIVTLSSLRSDADSDSAALDEAMAANADAQEGLHTRIEGNDTLTSKLEEEGYAVEDVVSIKTNQDGSTVVYVDDRS